VSLSPADALAAALLAAQTTALLALIVRLLPGRTRRPPIAPLAHEVTDTTVSVIVATLDEAARIEPCLRGLRAQRRPLLEVLVVDSRSADGTRAIVEAAATADSRIQLLTDDPLPGGWVGKVWALEHGLRAARGEWILGVDADTEPAPGMVAAVVDAARAANLSVVSVSPRFTDQTRAEQFLQPALLLTLVYRGGVAGAHADPERVVANGQCFLARRDVLLKHGGYAPARASFADDVTLARHLARRGERVGFLDGSRIYAVRSYGSAREMWREWGRSLDLANATSVWRQWADIALLAAVQGLPLFVLAAIAVMSPRPWSTVPRLLVAVNATALAIRLALLWPLSRSYARPSWAFWLSWVADPLAVVRIVMSTVVRRRAWRGRQYPVRATNH
jgi:dolichol-phosphate mannosyltransferase